jgi:hypothetical protein
MTNIKEKEMTSNDLRQALDNLQAKGIDLEQAATQIKVPAQLILLYKVGGMVPDRIIKGLNKLLEA